MKKIVFFMPYYALPVPSTRGGGVEELMTLLLNENSKAKKTDYEFYFVMKKLYGKESSFEDNKTYNNCKIVKVKFNRFFNFLIRGLNTILRKLKIKIRFSNCYYSDAFNEIKKIKPDYIIFERDYDVITKNFTKYFGKNKMAFHVHTQILDKKRIDNYFSSLISVSNFISNDWHEFLGEKINYEVLSNCVNEERFTKSVSPKERDEIRSKYGFSEDDFVVVLCGRICEDKGTDKLIDAILSLDEKIKLLIVGSVNTNGNEKTPYLKMIQDRVLQNPDKIKTTGYVKNSELYKVYNAADLQCTPSMWEEAAGLVVVEGQLCGLPQIITKSGGMPEFVCKKGNIVVEKDENIVENLAKEIKKLYENKPLREKISKENKKFALEFGKSRYYKEFIEILDKTTQNKN